MTDSLHRLQWATSHNSYDSAQQKVAANLPFDPARFYDAGFRGVELDIVQHDAAPEWCVRHGGFFSFDYKLLSSYLVDLRDWSRQAAGHDPVFIHLDCKDFTVREGFPDQLDGYLQRFLGDQPVYRPADLIRSGSDLMQSAMASGWPTPDSLAGRFIVVLTGERSPKENYASTSPASRLCFADVDLHFGFDTDHGSRIIANSDAVLLSDRSDFGSWCAARQAVLWRVYFAETAPDFDRLANLGANMIAAATTFPLSKRGFWPNPKSQGTV